MWSKYCDLNHSVCNINSDGYVYKHGRLIGYPSWFIIEEYDKRHIECRVIEVGLDANAKEECTRRTLVPDIILSPYIDRWETKPPTITIDGEFVSTVYTALKDLMESGVGTKDAIDHSLGSMIPDGDVILDFHCVDLAFALSTSSFLMDFFLHILVRTFRNTVVHIKLTMDNNEYENRTVAHGSNVLYFFMENLVYYLLTKNSSRNSGFASLEIVDQCKDRGYFSVIDNQDQSRDVLDPDFVRKAVVEAFKLSSWIGDGSIDVGTLCIHVGHLKTPPSIHLCNVNAPVSYVKYNSDKPKDAYFGNVATFVLNPPDDEIFNWALIKCTIAHVKGLHFPITKLASSHAIPSELHTIYDETTLNNSIRVLDLGYFNIPMFVYDEESMKKLNAVEYLRCGTIGDDRWFNALHKTMSPVAFEWNSMIRVLNDRCVKPVSLINLVSDHATHVGVTHPDDLYWLTPELDANSWTSASFVDIPPYSVCRCIPDDTPADQIIPNINLKQKQRWPFINLFRVKISVVNGGPLHGYLSNSILRLREEPLLPHVQKLHIRCPIDMFITLFNNHLNKAERLEDLTVYCESRYCDDSYIKEINKLCQTAHRLKSLSLYTNPGTTVEYILNHISSKSLQSLYLNTNDVNVPGISTPIITDEFDNPKDVAVQTLRRAFPEIKYCLCYSNSNYNIATTPQNIQQTSHYNPPPVIPIRSIRKPEESIVYQKPSTSLKRPHTPPLPPLYGGVFGNTVSPETVQDYTFERIQEDQNNDEFTQENNEVLNLCTQDDDTCNYAEKRKCNDSDNVVISNATTLDNDEDFKQTESPENHTGVFNNNNKNNNDDEFFKKPQQPPKFSTTNIETSDTDDNEYFKQPYPPSNVPQKNNITTVATDHNDSLKQSYSSPTMPIKNNVETSDTDISESECSLRYIGMTPDTSLVENDTFSDTSVDIKKFGNITKQEVASMRPVLKAGFTPNPYLTGEKVQEEFDDIYS